MLSQFDKDMFIFLTYTYWENCSKVLQIQQYFFKIKESINGRYIFF